VPNYKSFRVTEAEKSMSYYARDFNNMVTRAVIKSFFLARQDAEAISRHSYRIIRGKYTIVCQHQ